MLNIAGHRNISIPSLRSYRLRNAYTREISSRPTISRCYRIFPISSSQLFVRNFYHRLFVLSRQFNYGISKVSGRFWMARSIKDCSVFLSSRVCCGIIWRLTNGGSLIGVTETRLFCIRMTDIETGHAFLFVFLGLRVEAKGQFDFLLSRYTSLSFP